MNFIDSHCHLNLINNDPAEVIDRAARSNVTRIIVPGIDLETSKKAIELAERFPEVYAAIGIHPHEVLNIKLGDLDSLKQLALHPKVVAIGEVGLDYHYPPFDTQLQKQTLAAMIELAETFEKPLVLHSRDALMDLVSLVNDHITSKTYRKETKKLTGVFHMFEGTFKDSEKILRMGFYFSIGGNITFNKNQKEKEIIENLGISNLLLETDSPYISPHPYRGTPNEPARIPIIAAKVAEIGQTQVELVAEITTKNCYSLFRLD